MISNASNFVPSMFISVGEKTCFFTLRYTELVHISNRDGGYDKVVSYHWQNLSTDAAEALEKAKDIAKKNGYAFNMVLADVEREMNEIQRSTAEQAAERQARFEANLKAQEEAKAAWLQSVRESSAKGIFAVGPQRGKPFTTAPRRYISWLCDMVGQFEEGTPMAITAEAVLAQVPHLCLPKPNATLVGEAKKRMAFDVTVVRAAQFERQSFNGFGYEVVQATTMVDKATGACLVVISTAFMPDVGEELTIKGTVKEHSEYKGQPQTILQRIAIQ